jgi:hypothetical protein
MRKRGGWQAEGQLGGLEYRIQENYPGKVNFQGYQSSF